MIMEQSGVSPVMEEEYGKIGCIIMASGLSERYGKNKLLEKLNGRAVILHAAGSLAAAGFRPVAVTRSAEVKTLMDGEGFACILHSGPKKSDTMHVGIEHTAPDAAGFLFMQGDQPLVRPASLRRIADRFFRCPERAVRLGYKDTPGSPVLFPASCREDLMAYTGDRGGMDVIRNRQIPCDIMQAEDPWELWDVDTPEKMEKARAAFSALRLSEQLQAQTGR